jgi:hypothetical protein
VRAGLGSRHLEFRPDGTIGHGAAGCERWWDLRLVKTIPGGTRAVQLEVFGEKGLTFRARPARGGGWRGAWVAYERTEVTLRPIHQEQKKAAKAAIPAQAVKIGKKGRKGPVFHVPKRVLSVEGAVGDVPKRVRNGEGALGDVPKRVRNGEGAIGDVPKRILSVEEAVRDVPKRVLNVEGAVGDVPKRVPNVEEAVGDVPKRPRNGQEPVCATTGRRRNARQPLPFA